MTPWGRVLDRPSKTLSSVQWPGTLLWSRTGLPFFILFGCEPERIGALIVLDVPAEHDVDSARLENVGQ